jgi:hypothetical protein
MRNQSLATPFMAKSSIVLSIVAIGLLAGTSAMAGDPVYKWKDANGQSHYSQQPPEGVKYETIATSGLSTNNATATDTSAAGAAQPAAAGQSAAQTARQKDCDIATKNAEMFANKPVVSMDIHGDGKSVTLTPEQQSAQLNLAKQQIAQFCNK